MSPGVSLGVIFTAAAPVVSYIINAKDTVTLAANGLKSRLKKKTYKTSPSTEMQKLSRKR